MDPADRKVFRGSGTHHMSGDSEIATHNIRSTHASWYVQIYDTHTCRWIFSRQGTQAFAVPSSNQFNSQMRVAETSHAMERTPTRVGDQACPLHL